MKTMLLSKRAGETRLAVLADGRLVDLAVEKAASPHLLHRVYKGRVVNVVPALDAAFVDIGTGVNAYLPLLGGAVRDMKGRKITVGASVLVQVGKEARGNKGPMLTSKISLAGRYVVLLGNADYIGVSKKITDDAERERLRAVAATVQAETAGEETCGYILRTAASEAAEAELRRDLAFLRRTWQSIRRRAERSRGPLCLYREADLVLRAVRDYRDDEVAEIRTDDTGVYERLCELCGEEEDEITITCEPAEDLFYRYDIEKEIQPLLERRIDLPCGGYLVFDYTEALTAIDVNSGTFRAGRDRDELARRVNREALIAIARQIRLRNLGGIIIVDFIDMHTERDRSELLAALRREVGRDRVRTVVVDMTALGLVEITRRKTGPSLAETRYDACPACGGTGRVRTPAAVAEDILAHLDREQREHRLQGPIDIEVHPAVYEYCRAHYPAAEMSRRYARQIRWTTHHHADREIVSYLAGEE